MRRTEARMRVLSALRIDAARGPHATGLTVRQIRAISGYRGKLRTLRQVVLTLQRSGAVDVVREKRPRAFAITVDGCRAAGSFPAAGEAYASTFDRTTRKERSHHAE
jgi:hypothetical protein